MFFFCFQLSIFASIILSLFKCSLYIHFHLYLPFEPFFNPPLYISSYSSSLTAANSFLSTLFSSLILAVFSLFSVIMVFISLSISLLLFPSSLLLGDLSVLEFFVNGFVPSSDVLLSSPYFQGFRHALTFLLAAFCLVISVSTSHSQFTLVISALFLNTFAHYCCPTRNPYILYNKIYQKITNNF
jgi:hypothetical protein